MYKSLPLTLDLISPLPSPDENLGQLVSIKNVSTLQIRKNKLEYMIIAKPI